MKNTLKGFLFIFSFFFFVSWFLSLTNRIEPQLVKSVETNPEPESLRPTIEEVAYDEGYRDGRVAAYSQMQLRDYEKFSKIVFADLDRAFTSYTAMEDVSVEDRERVSKIREQAYVDGYHKALELLNCPGAVQP